MCNFVARSGNQETSADDKGHSGGTVTVHASGLFKGQHPSSVGYVAISCYSLHRVFPSLTQKEDIFSNTLISSQFIEQRIFLSQRTVSSPLQRLEFPLTHRKIRGFLR